ncbi:hypothetical protein TRFO_10655 [Tritrichomonas foetus]|uniref:BIG2 domain-containing protein n=1 Tax=Tritrichomonas foetus TaxID=1144522 RepID=A0A1J4J7Q0_9EUKA|nr:hypothetical protein TRFO_10655 [Tritrichomonas foetus]|eukprot:OHS95168.1 hypothetical protein TRFO_10655 [Tritrichomonas foetus]
MIVSLFAVLAASEFKISHLNALLQFKDPKSSQSPHFTISAEGCCVNWASLNDEIIKVTPNYESNSCSRSALVEVVATGPKRKSTTIIAENNIGQTLKCNIFVDSVASISILTTTRSIYVESSLETLFLQALDSEKNVFTSLEGTDIKWKIDSTHLREIASNEAKVSSNSPKSSASLIVQGTQIGQTWASAIFDGSLVAEVKLLVVEPIALFPSPAIRVLPFSHIPFQLCSLRGVSLNEEGKKCVEKITLPSSKYRIDSSNSEIVSLNQDAYATIHKVGTVTITATDRNVNDNTASSLVIVDYPASAIQDDQYISLGESPVFNPTLFDKNGRQFDVFEPIKWEIVGDWSTVGKKEITLIYHDFSLKAIVYVCEPITISPRNAVLPVNYKGFPISISGGSGEYIFQNENPLVLEVFQSNINTMKEGTSNIKVIDKNIPTFECSMQVIVSHVSFIDITLDKRETINELFTPICHVFALNRREFSVEVPYQIYSTDTNIVSNRMKPEHSGFTDIFCESDNTRSNYIRVSVATQPTAKVNGRASPNSIIPINIAGGVLQWPNLSPPHISIECKGVDVSIYDERHILVNDEFVGSCKLSMKNERTELNPYPLTVETSFQLEVANIHRFSLHLTDEKSINDPRCDSPPRLITKVPKDVYRVAQGHECNIFVLAYDKNDNMIKYYSADKFTVQATPGKALRAYSEKESDGSTKFYFSPSSSTLLQVLTDNYSHIKSNAIKVILVTEFTISPPKAIFFKKGVNQSFLIEGGSGIFHTSSQDSFIRDNILYIKPSRPGIFKAHVSDVCSDKQSQSTELNALDIVSLQIIAPTTVALNSDFELRVNAYGPYSQLIPQDIIDDAAIQLSIPNARKISFNTWEITPDKIGKFRIIARSENGVTATHTVDVIRSILISPQYLEILPGEVVPLNIVNGPLNMKFDYGSGKIARINSNFDVIAESPGTVTINVTVSDVVGLAPFQIFVKVLQPLKIELIPSSNNVIENGQVAFNSYIETDCGMKNVVDAKWTITDGFPYEMPNSSFVIVACNNPKDLQVSVTAYGLTTGITIHVEPKLKILTPTEIVLPPLSSYKILIGNKLNCKYSSVDENIAIVDSYGNIKSGQTEGNTIIVINYEHQYAAMTVRVSKPHYFYVVKNSIIDYDINVLDPFGLSYSSTNGIHYQISNAGEMNENNINYKDNTGHFTITPPSSANPLQLSLMVNNPEFELYSSFNISTNSAIIPENPVLIRGSSTKFQCSVAKPRWSIADRTIASVTSDGTVTAKVPGTTTLSCGNGITTVLRVVEMSGLTLLESSDNDNEFEIVPIYSPNILSHVMKPTDYLVTCELDDNTNRCGTVSHIERNGKHFCILNKRDNSACSPKAKVRATIKSTSSRLFVTSDIRLNKKPKLEQDDHTISMKVVISDANRKVEVPVMVNTKNTKIHSSPGLTAYFSPSSGSIVITADRTFSHKGKITLRNVKTGELIKIDVINDIDIKYGPVVVEQHREFKPNQDLMFYTTLVLIFAAIFYVIINLTSPYS